MVTEPCTLHDGGKLYYGHKLRMNSHNFVLVKSWPWLKKRKKIVQYGNKSTKTKELIKTFVGTKFSFSLCHVQVSVLQRPLN